MLQEVLDSKEYSLVYSGETGDLFISDSHEVFLFPTKSEDLSTIVGKAKAELHPAEMPEQELLDRAYDIGAEYVRIYGKTRVPVGLHQNDIRCSNPALRFDYSRLLITQEALYMKRLGQRHFIIPADFDVLPGKNSRKQLLVYPVAAPNRYSEKKYKTLYYMVFTDLSAFNEWNRKQPSDKWKPLQLEFWQLREVFGESGICINYGLYDGTFLNPEELRMIPCDVPEMGETIFDEEDLPI